MKTFEERYTAWIDGKLDGPARTAFELELSRRASAGEARADKTDAARLHDLLTTHLAAPAMTNTEFFSHQLRERIEADRTSTRRRESSRAARNPLFAWSFGRLAGLGGTFVFVAVALYYGLMPQHAGSPETVAKVSRPNVSGPVAVAPTDPPGPALAGPAPALAPRDPSQPIVLAKLDASDIQKLEVPDQSKTTTATPLHYAKPDVNVIWINGLEYMPSVPGESTPAAPVPPTAAPAQP